MKLDISFDEVKNKIKKLLYDLDAKRGVSTEVLRDDGEVFRISIETEASMAEVLVEKPDFAPYRWVRVEVYDLNTETLTYVWNDEEGDSLEKILEKIAEGLKLL
ncbi:MAG: hypothetical protein IJ791_04370 [Lachnospiraceae bacterium]|nr:hypothetical protein [Lachnospiraceae bacterium]